jgi:hypothetical protein
MSSRVALLLLSASRDQQPMAVMVARREACLPMAVASGGSRYVIQLPSL